MTEAEQRTPSGDVHRVLVDAAERVLVRDGPAGLTVGAVASEAGVAPMGVYSRFGNKEGLVTAVLVRGFDALAAGIGAEDGDPPEERLVSCGRRYRRFALDHPQHYEVMFGTTVSAATRAAASTEELAEHAGAAFGVLVAEVSRAMDAGVLRRADPRETAQVIWSAVHGAVTLELAGVTQVDDPDVSFERLLAMLQAGLS